MRKVFQNVPGGRVEQLTESEKYQSGPPDIVDAVDSWEAPSNTGDNYGQRIRGFLLPLQTGDYVFYLASDDASELYISSDESLDNCKLVAKVTSWGQLAVGRAHWLRGRSPSIWRPGNATPSRR